MRGNVSTYHLNMEDIANLVDPIMMPPSPAVLEAMIGSNHWPTQPPRMNHAWISPCEMVMDQRCTEVAEE